jgi:hypothetical protein
LLRPAFSRLSTFLWFATIVAGDALDEALKDTFPASDPVSVVQPTPLAADREGAVGLKDDAASLRDVIARPWTPRLDAIRHARRSGDVIFAALFELENLVLVFSCAGAEKE